MEELKDFLEFLKNKGLDHKKIDLDVMCGIMEYFGYKHALQIQNEVEKNKSFSCFLEDSEKGERCGEQCNDCKEYNGSL